MVWGVSLLDHDTGCHAKHSVPTVPVVREQFATSNPLASTSVSFNDLA
jgi:hypothetical protein